jgi:RNA polymerase sigma-70 factor, ECF subfamily
MVMAADRSGERVRGVTVERERARPWPSVTEPGCRAEDLMPTDLVDALHQARRGREAGFVTLYRDLQPRLFRYATVLVGRDDAEDVTAEAWLQIARDLPTFSGDLDGFRGWTSTVVRNRAMDLLRSRSRRPATPCGLEEFTQRPAADDTAADALEAISTDAAVGLIASLPPTEAEAVLLRAVVGLDTATTAAVLGKRAGAVRVAAHRGLKRLARHIGNLPQEGGWTVE